MCLGSHSVCKHCRHSTPAANAEDSSKELPCKICLPCALSRHFRCYTAKTSENVMEYFVAIANVVGCVFYLILPLAEHTDEMYPVAWVSENVTPCLLAAAVSVCAVCTAQPAQVNLKSKRQCANILADKTYTRHRQWGRPST